VAEGRSALSPCDLNAPFGNITKVPFANQMPDSDFNNFNGLTFSSSGTSAYLSSPHLTGTSYDIMKWTSGGVPGVVSGPDVQPPNGVLTSFANDTAPFLRSNGLTMYLNRNDDILTFTRPTVTADDLNWVPATTPPGINTSGRDQDAFFVESLNTLFFATDRPDGQGGIQLELWRRTSSTGSLAQIPGVDLNDPIENDYHPVMSSNGLQLYFASTRTGIAGDHDGDIFVATRTSTANAFGPASDVYMLNSSGQEFPVAISSDNCTLYFASNEEHGASSVQNHRLYQAKRQTTTPPSAQMTLRISGTGTVTGGGFNCSHVAANPPGGTGTCTASAAPGTLQVVTSPGNATWIGSCTGNQNGSLPTSNGLLTYGEPNGVCNVNF
jgi:hypothetical protein